MQYRNFGSLDWKVSALGFGCMRFPVLNENSGKIDEKHAAEMLYYAIDQGVNYLDTAYPYHRGRSEGFVGKTIKGPYREKVKLATKLPCWKIEQESDFDLYLNEQLDRLLTEQIDFYLLHALDKESWLKVERLGVLAWAEKALRDGRIAHLGFSFHDEFEVFKTILDAYEWEFCQIQYNFMDVDYQAGQKGLFYAAEKGVGVIIMEPLRGGRLIDPPGQIQQIWDTSRTKRSSADWSLQWLWNQPQVTTVLSGMSTLQHVKKNVESASTSGIKSFTEEELTIVSTVREAYQNLALIPCTRCGYCVPCPEGVDIPRLLGIYNDSIMYDKHEYAMTEYNQWVPAEAKGNNCVACNECEEKCPQDILIAEWIDRIHQTFAAE